MSELIAWEWKFLIVSMMWGMFLSLIYDCLRIVRRVFVHRKVTMLAVEDILFWMFSGFAMFHVIFMVNNGIIRSFALIGFIIGSAMYQYTVSYYLVKYISWFINRVKKVLIKVIEKILINPLKKIYFYIKIKVQKHRLHKKESNRNGKLVKAGCKADGQVRNKKKQRVKKKKTKTF